MWLGSPKITHTISEETPRSHVETVRGLAHLHYIRVSVVSLYVESHFNLPPALFNRLERGHQEIGVFTSVNERLKIDTPIRMIRRLDDENDLPVM